MDGVRKASLQVRFFAVDVRRQPGSGAHVEAPTVEVEVSSHLGLREVGAVEADDIVILVFDPDTPLKAPRRGLRFGLDINHETANFAEELPAHKREVVILLLEVGV